MVTKTIRSFLVLMIFVCSLPLMAKVPASVDRTNVGVQQSFHLTIDVSHVNDYSDMDLSVLQPEFQVLGRSSQSSTTIINGRISQKREIVLTLMPLQEGVLTIPAIAVGNDKTSPVQIKVSPLSDLPRSLNSNEIMLKSEVNHKSTFVQQEVLYTLKLYVGTQIDRASLVPPKVVSGDAVFEQIGKEKNYEITVKGKRYVVYEYQYSIIPQKSGTVVISPALFRAVKQERGFNSGIDSIFDDMFNTPAFGSRGKPIELASNKISLNVKKIPSSFRGKDWLPAQSLTIFDEWDKSRSPYPAGEPITRTITVTAEGLASNQLPELELEDVEGVKQYAAPGLKNEEIVDGVKITSLTTTVTIIPTTSGKVTLPEIKIPWWNTKKNRAEVAKLKAVTITVKGSVTQKQDADNTVGDTSSNTENNTVNDVDKNNLVDSGIAKNTEKSFWKERMDNIKSEYYWYLIILFVIVLLSYMFYRKRKTQSTVSEVKQSESFVSRKNLPPIVDLQKKLIKKIEQSCRDNDAQATRNNLLEWAKVHWPEESNMTMNKLIDRVDNELALEVKELNEVLYKTGNSFWRGEKLAKLIHNITKKSQGKQDSKNKLEPLYKQK
ncbi:MAG TPA: protein BatD [Aeromonadales bacterium]|nr:protein BatD [Aeromonadales bacterium]